MRPCLIFRRLLTGCFLLLAVVYGYGAEGSALVVTTTSVLGAAVRAVSGDRVAVETLLPPGSCPGHFDLEPSQVRRLRAASLFFRHDFQGFLDSRLLANGMDRGEIAVIQTEGGLCVPGTFASLGRAVAERLAEKFPGDAATFRARADALEQEAKSRGQAMQERAACLRGCAVAAAAHQVAFLRWLGLDVEVVLPGGDDPAPGAIARAVAEMGQKRVIVLVGNAPSGRIFPAALAEASGRPLVMCDNFPSSCDPADYWAMLDHNLEMLLKAVPK